jgi:hypothetical protein
MYCPIWLVVFRPPKHCLLHRSFPPRRLDWRFVFLETWQYPTQMFCNKK